MERLRDKRFLMMNHLFLPIGVGHYAVYSKVFRLGEVVQFDRRLLFPACISRMNML